MQKLKQQGNKYFQEKNYEEAIIKYKNAISLVEENMLNCTSDDKLSAIIYTNLGNCYFLLNNLELAEECSLLAIQKNPEYVKVYIYIYIQNNIYS